MPYVQITLSKYELIVMLKIVCPFHDRVVLEIGPVKPRVLNKEKTFTANLSSMLSIQILKSPKINGLCGSNES